MTSRAAPPIAVLAAAMVLCASLDSRAQSGAKPDEKGAAAPQKLTGKKPAAPPILEGTTYDYTYDGKDVGHPERAWLGRAFIPKKATHLKDTPLPLLVFVHGLNTDQIKYRWMGGGNEGDVRRIVSDLIDRGAVPPMLVAAPSSVVIQNIAVATTSWMGFDLDHFIEKTAGVLKGGATIDRTKIIVAGHSGGGCNVKGGIATAAKAKAVHTVISIDTCMGADLAAALAQVKRSTNVLVTWQSITWQDRPIKDFRAAFDREVKASPADAGVLRTLDPMIPTEPMPHDAMVKATLGKWLPVLLPPPKPASSSVAAAPKSETGS